MVVQLVRDGMLFGADRNVTTTLSRGPNVVATGQTLRPKVLKWPNHEIVIGYVGRATIDAVQTDEWLYQFIGRNLLPNAGQPSHADLQQLAHQLKADLERDLRRYNQVAASPMVLHLGAFVEDANQWKPEVWYIRNSETPHQHVWDAFKVSEEISEYFVGAAGNQIQAEVERLGGIWEPFGFTKAMTSPPSTRWRRHFGMACVTSSRIILTTPTLTPTPSFFTTHFENGVSTSRWRSSPTVRTSARFTSRLSSTSAVELTLCGPQNPRRRRINVSLAGHGRRVGDCPEFS